MQYLKRFSFFPAPAEGETIYSWLCRYHLMSGHCSFRANTLASLGVSHGRASNEFPSFLPSLSIAAEAPMDIIIRFMTPYNYYASFLPLKRRQLLWECLRKGETGSLQSMLGAVASRLTPGQMLFSCSRCIGEDIECNGFPFWHLDHQLTGVVACSRHREVLHATPRVKSKAILPELAIERPSTCMEGRYASLIRAMLREPSGVLTSLPCIRAYKRRLFEMGMITVQGHIRFRRLRACVDDRLKGVEVGSTVFDGLRTQLLKAQFPECLFYKPHVNHHPLKHLVFVEALFEDWTEFVTEVKRTDIKQEAVSPKPSKAKKSPKLSHKAKYMLRSGKSLRAVSRAVGLSVFKLKDLALSAGIAVDSRPTKIFVDAERAIRRMLTLCERTSDIALKQNVSVGSVEKVLGKYPVLVRIRKHVRFFRRQEFHRSAILRYVECNPLESRQLIRRALGASYIWLYKHDKEWLYQKVPPEIPRSQRFSQ